MNAASIAALQQLQTLIAAPNLSSTAATTTWLASIATQLQTIGADTSAPSVVITDVNNVNTAAGRLAQDITNGDPETPELTALGQTVATLVKSASGAVVLSDVATNTCTGYSNKDVSLYQGAAGIPVTGIYDAATVASLVTLFGASAVPPVCASGSGSAGGGTTSAGSITSSSGTTSTSAPTSTSTSATTTALIVGASVIAIGGLAFLLYQSGKAATALKTNPRKRRV